jgi:predicted amidohydrolase YtcJ
MYQPYEGHFSTDPPGGRGSLVTPPDELQRFVDIANRNGVIAMIHCSGDKATDMCLDAFEHEAATRSLESAMRIEHFGMFQLSEAQLRRASALRKQGLFISVQPTWLLDLAKADVENMGNERARTGFRFRALIDAGLEPAAGTDVTGIYLANVDPFLGIYAAVTRESDMGVFEPAQAVSVTEALKMWTIWAARAMGEEAVKGSIEPGKFADMAVLSDDIFAIPHDMLKGVRVLKTILGGAIVYEAGRGAHQ